MPSQKVGTPSASALQPAEHAVEPGTRAQARWRCATGMPSSKADQRGARRASCRVAGRRCGDQVEHRLAAVDRGAEIAGSAFFEPDAVLHQHRTVETELLRRGGDLLRRGILADDRRRWDRPAPRRSWPRCTTDAISSTGRSCRSRRAT